MKRYTENHRFDEIIHSYFGLSATGVIGCRTKPELTR